jgi:predicted nucleic acid-binding protein
MTASQRDSSAADKPLKPARLVLDTNVVLDWLVFKDPRLGALAAALEHGTVAWSACPRMRSELVRTLTYPALASWKPDSERTLAFFDRLAMLTPDPENRQAGALLCSDPDDQVFIELALSQQASWLLTRDRALLKLKRRAAAHGLQIAPPEIWTSHSGSP